MPSSLIQSESTQHPALSPQDALVRAFSENPTAEMAKQIVDLQQSMERFQWEREERQSRIDFDNALNACQTEIGRVAPNAKRSDTNSWWADYKQVDAAVRPVYTSKGFSISFSQEPCENGRVRVVATLARGGISRPYAHEIATSTTGPKGGAMATQTDADAIANSRCKRYLLLAIFNIAVGIDADEKAGIPDDRFLALRDMLEDSPNRDALTQRWKGIVTELMEARDFKSLERLNAVKDALKTKMGAE